MTDSATSFEAVLDSVIAERGGRACFSVSDLAVASALARTLVSVGDGNPSAAASIASLAALLPPKAEPTPSRRAWDLSRLSPKQLDALEVIACVATGERPPTKPRQRAMMFEEEPRYFAAREFVELSVAVDARDGRYVVEERWRATMLLNELFPRGESPSALLASPWVPPWLLVPGAQVCRDAPAAPVVPAAAPAASNDHDNVVSLRPPA